MGRRVVSSLEFPKPRLSFTAALASALFEWLLMFMLLVYGLFGYVITKFARYCELQIPCLLCSRIDHILGSEKAGFYRDMICKDHKLELSSLVFCHFHEKLVDVRGMCESCLFSFATKDKSNAETYRLLVGKLGAEDISGFEEDSLLDDHKPASSNVKHCCCCNELWTSRRHSQTLLQTKSLGFDATEYNLPLNREFSGERDDLRNEVKNQHHSAKAAQVERKMEDSPFHFAYSKLKITSDSDSFDNEDTRALISNDPLRDVLESTPVEPFIAMSDDEKPDNMDVLSREPSHTQQVQSDVSQPHVGPMEASTSAISHGLEELNWQEVDQRINPSTSTGTTNVTAIESSNAGNTSVNISQNGSDVQGAAHIQETEVIQVQETNKTQVVESSKVTANLNGPKTRSDHSDSGLQLQLPILDLVDAYKLAVSSRGRQLSGKLAEQLAGKESPRISGDLKLLLSQFSRGFELPNDVMSPRISRNLDELKTYDSSASIGMKLLQKRLSLERNDSRSSLDRNESGFESLDFSAVSEIEGESELDRLKRQLEHDRKFVSALLKELEEERNASAISTNEAMAMITRLQEEKAALQMEASQGLRIMEEQAEYDMEALDKLNELLSEKDKEIEDLEAALEYYRNKYPNESFSGNREESASDGGQSEKLARSLHHSVRESYGHGVDSEAIAADSEHGSKHSLLEIEDEKEYISRCLNNLEKKLSLLSGNIEHRHLSKRDHLEEQGKDSSNSTLQEEDPQIKSELAASNALSQKDSFVSKGSLHDGADVVALGYELCNLNERLQAIEADQSFLERAISTLKIGEEGLVQEIASHLRELRNIGIRRVQVLPED